MRRVASGFRATPGITIKFPVSLLSLPQDPAAASISDGDCDAREGESVAMNYKPSPLQVKLGECVWRMRAMWEVNKILSGRVYSKALQLK